MIEGKECSLRGDVSTARAQETEERYASSNLTVMEYAGDDGDWDEFVASSTGSTFSHLAGWRSIMSGVLGANCQYAVVVDEAGKWHGVLPLVHTRSRLFGDYLVSMPFLNAGGPLGSPTAKMLLAEFAVSRAKRANVNLLELRSRHEQPAGLRAAFRKVMVLLPLPSAREEMWSDIFAAKLRSQIRRPMKEGMKTRFGLDQLPAFYEVFARNMRDLGTPVLPLRFFERVVDTFPDLAVIGVVYAGTKPVAGGLGLRWRGEFEMTWASSLREYNHQAPNMLLYWAFIERMIGDGLKTFNFGRCSPGGGTHRFKRQWGGEDVTLPWGQWSASGIHTTPSPDRPLYRAATAMWRRLPLPLANLAGPHLARRIP